MCSVGSSLWCTEAKNLEFDVIFFISDCIVLPLILFNGSVVPVIDLLNPLLLYRLRLRCWALQWDRQTGLSHLAVLSILTYTLVHGHKLELGSVTTKLESYFGGRGSSTIKKHIFTCYLELLFSYVS